MTFEPEALLGEDDGLVLRRFFAWGVGHGFDLAIVQITTPWKRDALIAWAKANVPGVAVIDLREIGPDKRKLWDVLREATAPEQGTTSLILHGLEEAEAEERIVAQLNVERDELARGFPLPWLFIVHPTVAQVMERKAPDFADFAGAWMWEEKPEPLRLELAAIDARYAVAAPLPMDTEAVDELLAKAAEAINFGYLDEAADFLAQYDLRHPNAQSVDPDRMLFEANLLLAKGRFEQARAIFERARKAYEATDDSFGVAAVLHHLATIAENQGRYEEARSFLERSIAVKATSDRYDRIPASLNRLASIAERQGRLDEARGLLAQAQMLLEQLGDRAGLAASQHQLAILEMDEGRNEEARTLLLGSLATNREIGDRVGCAASLHQLAMIACDRGELDDALKLLEESSALHEEIGDVGKRAASLHLRAVLESGFGRNDEARNLLRESIAIRKAIGDVAGLSTSRLVLGQIEVAAGHFTEGRRLVQAAVDTLEAIGSAQAEEARSILRDIDALQTPPSPT
ncbi:tetratricopeptide repeat protein [Polyangium fumosum]|uniref:Tetratricopeptide repeat protein n=1 Tax=Polyangium fumosum TaxID=889272 RepID=A0A4U1JD59_9BACT|nr:tetratricopeptide repeat protein [Polyangium fumosum]TKD08622.1 tetratricopeptide repeat protein [Polyangium fumosum]